MRPMLATHPVLAAHLGIKGPMLIPGACAQGRRAATESEARSVARASGYRTVRDEAVVLGDEATTGIPGGAWIVIVRW